MPLRTLPVRPDLEHLKRQAKELLLAINARDATAIEEFEAHHRDAAGRPHAKLADAQFVLARSYRASSWTRLVHAVKIADAIWRDDVDEVRTLVTRNPALIREPVLLRTDSNWGPPMTYAANLGRDRIIRMLHALGATDLGSAASRAALQGHVATHRMLHGMAGQPPMPEGALVGPAYTLNVAGTAHILGLGARVRDDGGRRLAPVDVVVETDARSPAAKHAILEMYANHGLALPDTPAMALHRGRIDLLEAHLERDPRLLDRTFSAGELYSYEVGDVRTPDATLGTPDPQTTEPTPLAGATLLHMCVEFDEIEIARWLIERGANVNARAEIARDGFGGHTPLFNCVASQPNFWMNYRKRGLFVAPFTELLLENGADANARASIRVRLGEGHDPTMTRHEYRDVTPLSYGRQFHARVFVSEPALGLIKAAGGRA